MTDATGLIEAPGMLIGGRYVLGEPIAVGGGATVLRAHDTRLGRDVAVKRPLIRGVEADARIRREATILARCAHPGIVTSLDVVDDGGGACLVMQLIEGANLVQHAKAGAIAREAARGWALDLCRAVAFLQARGIVHGDLKPQHAVVDRASGRVMLVDFDRAHEVGASTSATASGVEAYAAPEILDGAATSLASDRYALGAVLRWLLGDPAGEVGRLVEGLLDADPASRPPVVSLARAVEDETT